MAYSIPRILYKYVKCLVAIVLVSFFTQILVAVYFFPSENGSTVPRKINAPIGVPDSAVVSARKIDPSFEDDEDLSVKNSKTNGLQTSLRVEELDFVPPCDITNKEAVSAIHRAKTQNCKKQLVYKTCVIQEGNFYPKELINSCPKRGVLYGKYVGCFRDEKKMRLLTSFYGNYANTNSPRSCLDICVQAGFPYAGVQYVSECFCGENRPEDSAKIDDSLCDMTCPGDKTKTCGGYFTMNVYETGLKKFEPQIPKNPQDEDHEAPVKIIFLLTLNGRALRQVHRLINSLYRTDHYFYIHVDARQDYLHRKLSVLENKFQNIKLARNRFSTIWGGASLLQMLLASMRDFFALGWQWDFVINLSESDFPIKSLEVLERFLSVNKGLNFVKSHGREVQRFIKKQGLDKTFVECEAHMWRIGERKLPRGIVIDGGSDWIALSPEFVAYIVGEYDELLTGLETIFKHTLLPAESFFHTALRNSRFCNTYVDNNLHVTNWKRKLGCKCQYKHVVDWCGCSPNDFRAEDWPRIQNTQDRQLFFARKFEPIINQEIITRVEKHIGYNDHSLVHNLHSYWQSIYNTDDLTASSDDELLTHAGSLVRHNSKLLLEQHCQIEPGEILEITSYKEVDIYKGNLILYKALMNSNTEVVIETWYKPYSNLIVSHSHTYSSQIKLFKVSSDYDQKEIIFRNFANILGPLSKPVLLYQLAPPLDKNIDKLSLVWVDPVGAVADLTVIELDEGNLTNFVKPDLRLPLLPGVWKAFLLHNSTKIVETRFLITPLEYFSGKEVTREEADIIHSGSQNSYKSQELNKLVDILPSHEESIVLKQLSQSNVRRIDQDLKEWIDSLSYSFYNILGSCISSSLPKLQFNYECGDHLFKECSSTSWSSLSPDPKGTIGKLNKQTGRLERV